MAEKNVPNKIKNFLDLKKENSEYPFRTFIRFLDQPDHYISHLGSKILALLMLHSKELEPKDVAITFKWIGEQLKEKNLNKRKIAVLSLKTFLRNPFLRTYFSDHGGFNEFVSLQFF